MDRMVYIVRRKGSISNGRSGWSSYIKTTKSIRWMTQRRSVAAGAAGVLLRAGYLNV